jgi:hypothetical protein
VGPSWLKSLGADGLRLRPERGVAATSSRLLLRIRASATFEPRPHAVVTLTGLRCVPCARCRFFSSFCLKVFGSGLSKIFLYHVYVFLEFLENMTFCVFP